MAKPKNKNDLLLQTEKNYKKLIDFVESFSKEEQERDFPDGSLNRNIKDVLAHLHAWHLLLLDWYTVGMSGDKPVKPVDGYTWKDLPQLNRTIQERYAQVVLEDAKGLLRQSFKTVLKLIEMHSDEDLFAKKKYHWTGSTSLGAYVISATSSHYHWAYQVIKKAKKEAVIF